MAQSQPGGEDGRCVQRRLACNSAHTVGAEKFTCRSCAHGSLFLTCHLGFMTSTRLLKDPSLSRVVTRLPTGKSAAVRTSAPPSSSTRAYPQIGRAHV